MDKTLKNPETREQREARLRMKVSGMMERAEEQRRVNAFLVAHGYSPNRKGKRAFAKQHQIPIRQYTLQEAERMVDDAAKEISENQELVQPEDPSTPSG